MNFTTTDESLWFALRIIKLLTKYDTISLLNSFSHFKRNQYPMKKSLDSTSLGGQGATTDSLEHGGKDSSMALLSPSTKHSCATLESPRRAGNFEIRYLTDTLRIRVYTAHSYIHTIINNSKWVHQKYFFITFTGYMELILIKYCIFFFPAFKIFSCYSSKGKKSI